MLKNISNLGDAALYCDFGNKINRETNLNLTQRSSDTKAELVDPFFALTQNYLVKIILPIPLFHPSLVLACST